MTSPVIVNQSEVVRAPRLTARVEWTVLESGHRLCGKIGRKRRREVEDGAGES